MSNNTILEIKDLSTNVGEEKTPILRNVDLTVDRGETHIIMGPNGAGKSTLGFSIMGGPSYEIDSGKIIFEGEDVTELSPDKRAMKGIYLSFQNPIEVPGITMRSFLRSSLQQLTGKKIKFSEFNKILEEAMEMINMDPSYIDRDVNVGFSGGEKKKAEILQLLVLKPKLAILDETDSGLDVDAVRTVSQGISAYKKKYNGTLIIITHNAAILEALDVDKTHVLVKGRIVKSGGAELIDEINRNGFEKYIDG